MRDFLKKIAGENLRKKYRGLRFAVVSGLMKLFGILPINRRRVAITNVWGYGDNSKYVAEALLKASKCTKKNLKIFFISEKNGLKYVKKGIYPVKNNSIEALFIQATAAVWIDCNHKEPYIKKRRGQYYVQCWHGPVALKKLDYDCRDHFTGSETYLENVLRDSEMTDLYVSNGTWSEKMYRNAFRYKGAFARVGTPRMDVLLEPSEKRIRRTKRRLGIPEDKPLALFAPTYREADRSLLARPAGRMSTESRQGTSSLSVVADDTRSDGLLDFTLLKKALNTGFKKDFALAVRMHPLVASGMNHEFDGKQGIIDGNRIPDLYAILEAADVLITDYSNTLFECGYVGKPVFLYAPDLCAYEWDRGFYMNYEKLPLPMAFDENGLFENIKKRRDKEYSGRMKQYLAEMGATETPGAADRVASQILAFLFTN